MTEYFDFLGGKIVTAGEWLYRWLGCARSRMKGDMTMERMTRRKGSEAGVSSGYTLGAVVQRLADYEDTGLTPEEISELALARREGRLFILPLEGDTVYFLGFRDCERCPRADVCSEDAIPGNACPGYVDRELWQPSVYGPDQITSFICGEYFTDAAKAAEALFTKEKVL